MPLRAAGVTGDDLYYCFVPGRIEFLGKHTDYAGGRSLICALERGFCVAAAARDDDRMLITDVDGLITLSSASVPSRIRVPGIGRISDDRGDSGCSNFPGALRGADIAFISDLPPAAGLSSSSALLIAIFSVLTRVNALDQRDEYRQDIDGRENLAGYLGTIENGQKLWFSPRQQRRGHFRRSQDHTAILCCGPGELRQYSFCPVNHERSITLPGDYAFVIGVSGVSADKTGAALDKYNRVSLLAAEALAIWRSATGRADATLMKAATSSTDAPERMREALRASRSAAFSPQELLNRFEQFVY